MPTRENERDPKRTRDWVDATALGNLWAGVGAAVLTLSLLGAWVLWWAAPLGIIHGAVSLVVGGVVYGLLSMLRFSLDEWRESGDRRRLEQMNAKLLVRDKERDAVLTDMRKELMRYKEQARRADLRGVAPTVADNRRVSPVADSILNDATTIIDRWATNQPYGRDDMQMERARWERAFRLLDAAGVGGRGGPGGRQRVITARNESEAKRAVIERSVTWEEFESSNYVTAN